MIGLDTNVLLRYLTQDDPAQAETATREIEQLDGDANQGFISLVVLCETLWTLTKGYRYTSADIDRVVELILMTREFKVENSHLAWAALQDFRRTRADFADCLIGRLNAGAGCEKTISFDQGARDLSGFEIL